MPNPKITGQRDGLGYLRWTPTACRRCGYEQVDCTCIGGFVAPQPTSDALAACPFCGASAAMFREACDNPWWVAECSGCTAQVSKPLKQDAAVAWNRRVQNV